jgi:hypothetical protein
MAALQLWQLAAALAAALQQLCWDTKSHLVPRLQSGQPLSIAKDTPGYCIIPATYIIASCGTVSKGFPSSEVFPAPRLEDLSHRGTR